ncbi:MAG: dTMP kinase, partial [Spirochaetota bacterium]
LPYYFAVDRARHVWGSGGICAQLQNGLVSISERYLFSSLVYQGQEVPLAELWQWNRRFPLPQHFVYLDIPPEVADSRIAQREGDKRREIFEQVDFQRRVRESYQMLIRFFRGLAPLMAIHCLDASWERERLHAEIIRCLKL